MRVEDFDLNDSSLEESDCAYTSLRVSYGQIIILNFLISNIFTILRLTMIWIGI